MRIRKVRTGSGKTAIQIGKFTHKSFKMIEHIGSGGSQEEIDELLQLASSRINKLEGNLSLFEKVTHNDIFDRLKVMKYFHNFSYDELSIYYDMIFDNSNKLHKDLTLVRLVKPCSKLESIELLSEYFNIEYHKSTLHRNLITIDKDWVVTSIVNYATDKLKFDFKVVFYDVTTLYFESFKSDNLRKVGFSKDNKFNQPQIVLGLVVNSDGFPLDYELFEGNKFEGHTIIPVILNFKEKHNIKSLVVVADAGMLSESNLLELENKQLHYLVGNRTGQTDDKTVNLIFEKISQNDNSAHELEKNGRRTIYHFSKKRYHKDKTDFKKYIQRAKALIGLNASKLRAKYIKLQNSKAELNVKLIDKHEKLLGIKSYKTNILDLPAGILISRYKDLWNVEKSFRITKGDLEARPIYHRHKLQIEAHLNILISALAIAKLIEKAEKTSLKKYIKSIFKIIDVTIFDPLTKKSKIISSTPH